VTNKAKAKSIIVTVSDDALPNIRQLADDLGAKGLKVDRVLPVTGVITGSCVASKVPALGKVDGVLSIEEEATARLPPSDSPVQ
jgi:hypothetical protein